jgi:hypothetical protein
MSGRFDRWTKAQIVYLILSRRTEEAMELLSEAFHVDAPKLSVGTVKGMKRAAAVYVLKRKTIYVSRGEHLWEPFVILHEFYHHLRSQSGRHRGTEKLADAFAKDFIHAYEELITNSETGNP